MSCQADILPIFRCLLFENLKKLLHHTYFRKTNFFNKYDIALKNQTRNERLFRLFQVLIKYFLYLFGLFLFPKFYQKH